MISFKLDFNIFLLFNKGVHKNITFYFRYDNFDHRTVLRQILHETNDSVRGYTKVGHIVHLNLREEFYGYKNIIGEVGINVVMFFVYLIDYILL